MTLLSIVQDALEEIGLDAPATVVGNPDKTASQALALCNRAGKSLAKRWAWQELTREFTHVTLAAELQGTVESIMPAFNWDVYDTLWNRSQQMPVTGPLSPRIWQALKASSLTGPYVQFRIRQKKLYFIPAPPAGETIAGEYLSKYWCQSAGGSDQTQWAADTDVASLDEDLLAMELKWRMLRAKGMDYAEEKLEAEVQINNAMARNGSNTTLDLGAPEQAARTTVIVPPGSWGL